jgi:phosphatidylserine/phosphatidylglycerophosphate/cardiolipin synthase-like enzyme
MRFKSKKVGGFRVWAVTGVSTVSFAIEADPAIRKGLVGFAVDRIHDGKKKKIYGFKVWKKLVPNPQPKTAVSTHEHPIQSFVWDDFEAKPGAEYTYVFHPLTGKPGQLGKHADPVSITVKTEIEDSKGKEKHDIFFNAGVASSQAYMRKFGNLRPDKQDTAAKKTDAFEFLSRRLDEALLRFIASAKNGDAIRGCFYEFKYAPVLEALATAIGSGVDVKCIVDLKENPKKKDGKLEPANPKTDNLEAIADAGIPMKNIVPRTARKNDLQHNKFMVLLRGNKPIEVWTGSTNLTDGGIHGQTNVGHWIRDPAVAKAYLAYWTLLATDPGAIVGEPLASSKAKNAAFKKAVEALTALPKTIAAIPNGTTPVFSPRTNLDALALYTKLLDDSKRSACITLAFGIGQHIKAALKDNTWQNAFTMLLLEKEDVAKKDAKTPFTKLTAKNNVYQAWGTYIKNDLYQWAKETNAFALKFNRNVGYIHSKFLLADPLSDDPIVVTGSANFSEDSTKENDENMVIIRGERRVADIYFTEFHRLFHHYYFRAVHEKTKGKDSATGKDFSLFLDDTDGWLKKYEKGTLRWKRVEMFTKMGGAKQG